MRLALVLVLATAVHSATAATIDPDALATLHTAAEAAHSDAVVVLQDGEPVAEWYFEQERRPIEIMSVLKSVVAIGVGRLLALGDLESLDQPVHAFYPEWKQGQKQEITLRHLLNHTSGLQDMPNAGAEIYPAPDAVKLALAAELSEAPGTRFRYNNKATNLLAGIIEQAYGQRMDQFFVAEIFRPLGIDQYQWYFDDSGTPHAMAGLELHARDLAKFGQLVLDGGRRDGEALLEEDFVAEMLEQSQPHYLPYGLLWWRLPRETTYVLDEARMEELVTAGVDAEDLERLEDLVGRRFTARADRDDALEGAFGPGWRDVLRTRFSAAGIDRVFRREYGEIVAYYGDGYLGQTVMVVPEHRLVAVRQVARDDDYDPATDAFADFEELVLGLVEE